LTLEIVFVAELKVHSKPSGPSRESMGWRQAAWWQYVQPATYPLVGSFKVKHSVFVAVQKVGSGHSGPSRSFKLNPECLGIQTYGIEYTVKVRFMFIKK
jgi:hypothetical protein